MSKQIAFGIFSLIFLVFNIRSIEPEALFALLGVVKTTSETNAATGEKIYTTVYPVNSRKALIRVKDYIHWNKGLYPGVLYPEDCKEKTLKIMRHHENSVIVSAILDKKIVELVDDQQKKEKNGTNYIPLIIIDTLNMDGLGFLGMMIQQEI